MTFNTELWNGQVSVSRYAIERSVRFNSSDSAYLGRTFSGGTNSTFTISFWVKFSTTDGLTEIFSASSGSAATADTLRISNGLFQVYVGNSNEMSSLGRYRDYSAWYHVVLSVSGSTYSLYVNGILDNQITNGPSSFTGWFQTPMSIGRRQYIDERYLDGYLADFIAVEGQALDPTSFGFFDTNGIWQPIEYTGSYGTNGFYLDFSDNSTAAALGTDTSGQGNNWSVNNISVAAGAGNDSLVDVPTNGTETDTGVGGEVRGNYCTINPRQSSSASNVTANGNLDVTISDRSSIRGTFYVSTGKWYYEVTINTLTNLYLGLASNGGNPTDYTSSQAFGVNNAGDFYENNSVQTEDSIALAAGSTYGIAFDADSQLFWISKDGQWYSCDRSPDITITKADVEAGTYGYDFSTLTGTAYTPHFGNSTTAGANVTANFGQRPFAYTAPSGFKALCTANLPSTTITTSGSYTGNGVADGPFVYLNGVPTAMTIGGNSVTFGTDADKLSNGFKIRTTSTTYNQNANTYNYTITSTGDPFKTARAQSNP